MYHWLDFIVLSDELYHIVGWIVSYKLEWIGLYRIGWIVSGNTGFYALAVYWLDGMDGLNGALVGRGRDGPTLTGAGMGVPLVEEARGFLEWYSIPRPARSVMLQKREEKNQKHMSAQRTWRKAEKVWRILLY